MECDGEGITSYDYKDTECKEEVSKTTMAWGCFKDKMLYITGASLVQVTLASLALGAASYMA